MKLTKKRDLIFKIILTILSLASSAEIFYALKQQVALDRLDKNAPHDPYYPVVIFALLFIINAVLYWLKDKKWVKAIQNIVLVVNLAFTLSTALSGWPAFINASTNAQNDLQVLVLVLTIVLGFIYVNLAQLTDTSHIVLFCLKFINSLLAVGVCFMLLMWIMIGGATFLAMPSVEQFWALIGMNLWILLNLIIGIVIWSKWFRSWWAWIIATVLAVELLSVIIYLASITAWWKVALQVIIVLVLIYGMTYLNNKLIQK